MSLFLWNDAHSIGISEIDNQHKDIFGKMQNLQRATRAGQSALQLEPTLIEFASLCEAHFRTEETLMAFHRFPGLEDHRSEHRVIHEELQRFLAELAVGKPGLIVDFLEYLEDYQGIHVLQHDMKYRDYLMEQWGVNFKRDQASPLAPVRRGVEERRYARLACSVPVELRFTTDPPVVYAQCVNISTSGAFLKTWSPVRVNTTATAAVQFGSTRAEVRVCVRRSEPCIGIGVSFLSQIPAKLQDFIRDLERRQPAARATDITCERLMHGCVQNMAALEDVISEAGLTQSTAETLRCLLERVHRLQILMDTHGMDRHAQKREPRP